jgi:hypothetical protein
VGQNHRRPRTPAQLAHLRRMHETVRRNARFRRQHFLDLYTVRPDDPDACWGWRGAVSEAGYASYCGGTDRRPMAHSFEIDRGRPKAKGMHLHHTCVNRLCTNARHLVELTPEQHREAERDVREAKKQLAVSRAA